jgi:prepilin-type processing-associated H-X9-DG protein
MRFQPWVKPILLIAAVVGLAGSILTPFFMSAKSVAERSSCSSNLRQIALACAQYAQDSDGRWPPISSGNKGWAELLPNVTEGFQCPSVGRRSEKNTSDYFFNAHLATISTSRLNSPMQTILFGDGLPRGGTNSHFSEMPFDWKTDAHSPAQRHSQGANYTFADGHVKFLWPKAISNQSPKDGTDWIGTFAVR